MNTKVSHPYVLACRGTRFVVRCPSLDTGDDTHNRNRGAYHPCSRSVQPHEGWYLTTAEQRQRVHRAPLQAPPARRLQRWVARSADHLPSSAHCPDVSPGLQAATSTLPQPLPRRTFRPQPFLVKRQLWGLLRIVLDWRPAARTRNMPLSSSHSKSPVRPYLWPPPPRHSSGVARSLARCPKGPLSECAHAVPPPLSFGIASPKMRRMGLCLPVRGPICVDLDPRPPYSTG